MENKRIIRNAKWIVICKIAQSLIQLPISMLTARYLGPSNYGLIGYAGAVVAFFVPITMLGLQNTLIKELVETPEETGLGRCECRLSLIERKVGIEDSGHAVAWAIEQLSK